MEQNFNIAQVIEELQKRRNAFVSEADFQLELAWVIKEKYPKYKVRLEYRPEFNIFATDQRPWRWSIDYDITSSGETDHGYCILEEYRKYLENDYALLKELKKRFTEMRGEKISEASES